MNKQFTLTAFLIFFVLSSSATAQVILDVTPSSQVVFPGGENATVNVTITGISDFFGFEFDVDYNGTLLTNNTDWDLVEGGFLSNNHVDNVFCNLDVDYATGIPFSYIDNYFCTRMGSGVVSGNGVLGTFNMTSTLESGVSYFNIDGLKLSDEDADPIVFNTVNNATITVAWCDFGPPPETRQCGTDVGECEFGTSTCEATYDWGNCVIPPGGEAVAELCDGLNNDCDGTGPTGDVDEDWPELGNACDNGEFGECLNTGNMICNVAQDGSECDASAGTPAAETCPWNILDTDCDDVTNEFMGDADCNCDVDIFDLSLIGSHFGETPADANWDVTADLKLDSIIDIFDLVTVGSNFLANYGGNPPLCP